MSQAVVDDLLSATANAQLYSVLAELREADPVRWSSAQRAWLLTRYEDVSAAFQNKSLSSDRVRPLLSARREQGVDEGNSASDRMWQLLSEWMVVSDPPGHTRLRRLAASAFKQQRIAAMGEWIQRLVDELIDAFVAAAHTDLIEHVAYPLPAIVIAEMLGARPEDRDRFRRWSDELALVAFGAGGEVRSERHARALHGLEEMATYIRELIAQRRRDPGEDMLSAMMASDESRDALSDDELVSMCALLLFAGHETTTNSIANAVYTLCHHPTQFEELRANSDIVGTATEELLRFDGPIKVLTRWVANDHELRGHTIRAGERVHLVLASANHDPARFADPDKLDLRRSPNPHMAFGKGVHACIGAQLARLETRIAVGTLIRRLSGLRLTDAEPGWKASLASRSLTSLPIAHDAGQTQARTQ